MFKTAVAILVLSLFVSSSAFAEIYKWTYDDGSIGFANDIKKVPKEYRDKVEIKDYSAGVTPGGTAPAEAPTSAGPSVTIVPAPGDQEQGQVLIPDDPGNNDNEDREEKERKKKKRKEAKKLRRLERMNR